MQKKTFERKAEQKDFNFLLLKNEIRAENKEGAYDDKSRFGRRPKQGDSFMWNDVLQLYEIL